jgi:hypothetical protein
MTDTPASWIILTPQGRAVRETFSQKIADDVNGGRWLGYRSVPVLEYLQSLNAKVSA